MSSVREWLCDPPAFELKEWLCEPPVLEGTSATASVPRLLPLEPPLESPFRQVIVCVCAPVLLTVKLWVWLPSVPKLVVWLWLPAEDDVPENPCVWAGTLLIVLEPPVSPTA